MSGHSLEARGCVRQSGPSWAYTRSVGSFAQRLTSVAMAFALSGSPAVLSACMALCLDSPVAASAMGGTQPGHSGHGGMTEPAAESPHAHHGTAAPTQPTATVATASPLVPSDARLVGSCDNCCVAGPIAFAAGPGVDRTDGKAFATAPAVSVVSFHMNAATHAATPPSPPVPPPSPTRAPLALRI
jgi:hypothetical protein